MLAQQKTIFGDWEDAVVAPKVTDYAHPSPPGTGPEGETCKSCAHCCYHKPSSKRYYKCELMKITFGAGTDIRLKDLACRRWESN